MSRADDPFWLPKAPYVFLVLGFISFCMGMISTWTGEAWARFGRVVRRDKEPAQFSRLVAAEFVVAACFVGYFLYRAYRYGFP